MKLKWLLAAFAAVLMFQMPGTAQAFECPKHFEAAEDAIDEANDAMIGLKTDIHMIRGHMLIDDAKMLLASAKHNHEKPQNEFDHARALAKADTALANAKAAVVYYSKLGTK